MAKNLIKTYNNLLSHLKEVKYQVLGTQKQCLKRKPVYKDDQTEIFISISSQDIIFFLTYSNDKSIFDFFSSKQVNVVYNSTWIYKYTISNFSLGITTILLEHGFSVLYVLLYVNTVSVLCWNSKTCMCLFQCESTENLT